MTELQTVTLELASRYVGIKELTDKNDGPFISYLQYVVARTMGMPLHALDGAPYCCMFATWMVQEAHWLLGVNKSLPVHCSSAGLFNWAKSHGALLQMAIPGCIGVLRGGPLGHQHTFLVESIQDSSTVGSIDANESNQIERTTHPMIECDWIDIA